MSPRFKLNRTDFKKLSASFALSASAALLVAISEIVGLTDWNSAPWGPLAGAMVPFVVNFARRFLTDYRSVWEQSRERHRA